MSKCIAAYNCKRFVNDWVVFIAASVDEALLQPHSRKDLRDLSPGWEHILRRKQVWALVSPEVTCYPLCSTKHLFPKPCSYYFGLLFNSILLDLLC